MAKIFIDKKIYEVNPSDNLLQACLSIGLDIPYFCWHPLLGSLGACRQCAVQVYNNFEDSQGRLVMSCMTPVVDGLIVSINDVDTKMFRRSVIELLLTNHPHDCPVCEEGGHCHLQDMTVMTQHNSRNYRFPKRTHKNQYLGSFIKHEMNRCISCYRCTRYYNDYAGGTDFGVYGANNNIYFGRVEDGVLENEHSGNLIELCPTGVFTDKTHSQNYSRKWDMQYAPGICQNCSIGCNISISERYGEIRRIENRYHESINHYLICDLGRFGYLQNRLHHRPTQPSYALKNNYYMLNVDTSIQIAENFFKKYKRIIGVGSTRTSLENNFALKELVGEENFSIGMIQKEQDCLKIILNTLKNNNVHTPSLKEIENYDCILILGEDVTKTAPRVALSIRQAIKNKAKNIIKRHGIPNWNTNPLSYVSDAHRSFLYIMHTHESKLDDIASWSYFASINKQVRLAASISYELDKNAPQEIHVNSFLKDKVSLIVKNIMSSKKTLIISGTHSYSSSIIKAAINITKAIKSRDINHHVGLVLLTNSTNALGAELIGGRSIEWALEEFKKNKDNAIIFMEYDLYRFLSKYECDIIFKHSEKIITLDHQYTQTYKKSGIKLPVTNFTESSGTVVNFEGRAQRFFQVYDPNFYKKNLFICDSWRWLHLIKSKIDKKNPSWINVDDVINAYSKKISNLKNIPKKQLMSCFRIHDQKIARSPIRCSGRTALRADIDVHEPAQPKDQDTMFSFSMEGYSQPNKNITHIPFAWSPGWNSPQAWNKYQKEVGKSLISGDSGVHIFKKNKKIIDSIYYEDIFDQKNIMKKFWHVIPYYHLFGNEELTQYSSKIQENIPTAYALIGCSEGIALGFQEFSIIEFRLLHYNYRLRVKFSQNLNSQQIGLPIGRQGFPISLIGKTVEFIQECET